MIDDWNHRETWTRHGESFIVEIAHWSDPTASDYGGHNRWAVYVYLYPDHPHFALIRDDDTWDAKQDAADLPGLHGGCTYLERNSNPDGTTASWQVGAHYSHEQDDRFALMATLEDAVDVVADAERLYAWLRDYPEVTP